MDASQPSGPRAKNSSTMAARAVSTFGLWALVVAIFVWGNPWGYALLLGGMAMLGTWEFHGIAAKAGVLPMRGLGLVGALGYTAALFWLLIAGHGDSVPLLDTAAFAVFLGLGFTIRLKGPVDGVRPVAGLAIALLGFVYIAFGMGFVARVIFHEYSGQGAPPAAWLGLWLAAVTKFTDVGAYLVGSAIGRHKLIPHISPGKTREGLLGAFVFALAAGCGLFAAFPTQLAALGGWGPVLGLSMLLASAAVVGDLAESFVKRSLAIKDSGHTLPGIGGIMDLIDSLCFTAPILYFYLLFTARAGI